MKIHEVVPLDKALKRKVLDYCRKQKIGGDLIYLGQSDSNKALSVKYNAGNYFLGLYVENDYIERGLWEGSAFVAHYFAFYKEFHSKSIVRKPAKPKQEDKAAEPDSLTTRLIRVEQKLDTLLKTMNNLTLKVEK
jgi:hypothetical protein